MSKHFDDARYYLKRAGEHAKLGVRETLEPAETRLREITGRQKEPDPSVLEQLAGDLKEAERDAEGEARKTIEKARRQLDHYRSGK